MTAEPECTAVGLTPADRLLLLASDGLWGVLSCQAAVDVAAACASAEQAAQRLVALAQQRWLAEENGCADDITVVWSSCLACDAASAWPPTAAAASSKRGRHARPYNRVAALSSLCCWDGSLA